MSTKLDIYACIHWTNLTNKVNLSTLSVPDEGYSRNASCALSLIYALLLYTCLSALNSWLVQYDNKLMCTVNIHCIWSTMKWFHYACITGTNTKANVCFLHLATTLNTTWSSLNLNISFYERIMSGLVEYLRYYHKEHNMKFYNLFA